MRRVVVSLLCVLLMAAVLPAGDKDYAVREEGGPTSEAKPDKASVYIVRPSNVGGAIRIWAFADDTLLGMTKRKTYTHAYFDPGTYLFWSRAENVSAIEHTVEAGRTYYTRGAEEMQDVLDLDRGGESAWRGDRDREILDGPGKGRRRVVGAILQDQGDEDLRRRDGTL